MSVYSIPSYCLVNIHDHKREWEAAGTLKECWDLLRMHYKSAPLRSVLATGWRIVPVRAAKMINN